MRKVNKIKESKEKIKTKKKTNIYYLGNQSL